MDPIEGRFACGMTIGLAQTAPFEQAVALSIKARPQCCRFVL